MATREQVRAAMHRQPFLGFTVHLVDGRSYFVKHPDFIAVSENERSREVTIYDKGTHRLDVLLISEIEEPEVPEPAQPGAEGNGE
jgi:hypothetical protein